MSAIAINPIYRAVRFYEAPIGKKAVMAITGVMLVGYVIGDSLQPEERDLGLRHQNHRGSAEAAI